MPSRQVFELSEMAKILRLKLTKVKNWTNLFSRSTVQKWSTEMSTPDITSLELDITYACGFGCNNCNRMTVVAPGTRDTNVTVSQVEKLIQESLDLDWQWRKWCLIGGEPTVHPDFWEILRTALKYRSKRNDALLLEVSTHGAGERTKETLRQITVDYPSVRIRNSRKVSPVQPDFVAINVAPRDLDPDWAASHEFHGCWIPRDCGIGFNYAGFYCCAVAGAIDRLCGLKLAIKNLRDVSVNQLINQYPSFCSMCGHYRPIYENNNHLSSGSWKSALSDYDNHKPVVDRY